MKIWTESPGVVFMLITPEELQILPEGTVLKCITPGKIGVVGRTDPQFKIDMDIRYGTLAYGFELPCFNHDRTR